MARHRLILAHSADADDVFMWWPITGKIDPRPPFERLSEPVIDTGNLDFIALPEDIQVLNRRAIGRADLDITAASFFAYPGLSDRYAIASCGSSFGEGFGPKLVAPAGVTLERLRSSPSRIAVPGLHTSAFCALSAMLGPGSFEPVETPFDRITETVNAGRAEAGVVIHEAQLTFGAAGLALVADLGEWWTRTSGLPMPLGANLIRRDLDERLGRGTIQRVASLLRRSLDHAIANRAESLDYARTFSPLKDRASLDRYVSMYVNRWTVDCRGKGAESIARMFGLGADLGLCPRQGAPDIVACDA